MGDNPEPLTDEPPATPPISHRRILIGMAVIIFGGSVAGFAFISAKVGVGVLIGGILAYANYFWQRHSLKAIFERAVSGKRSRFLAVRYILRYIVLGLVIAVIYLTQTVSIYAVVFGFTSFALAVVVEGFVSIFSSSNRQES